LGAAAVVLAVVGCGGGGNGSGKGGTTGKGGTGAGTGTGGTIGSGGTTGTGGGQQTSDYSFTVTPAALSLPLGGTQTLSVAINRDTSSTTFTDPITFTLLVPNTITGTGVTAQFTPNPATAATTSLQVYIGTTGVTAGSYTLEVVGTAGSQTYTVNLPLTVTTPKSTLLVDNDGSANNVDPTDTSNPQSPSDTLFATLLQGESIGFNTFVADESTVGIATDPGTTVLASYSTIVWYTGYLSGGTISPGQEAILQSWLDAGNHTLLLFSENLFYDLGKGDWVTPEDDTFLAGYVGAAGDAHDDAALDEMTYYATGTVSTAFAGELFQVIKDSPITNTGDVVNPATGTDVLATVVDNPNGQLAAAGAVPIAVGRKHVGTAGTSTVVYVGMPIENVLKTTGNNSPADFFHAALVYAGLK
jgi:hypothetical protein